MSGPYLFDVDTKELKKLERDLAKLKKALPYATRSTINALAFEGQRAWRQILPQKLTLRNRYTEQAIRVEQARALVISRQEARVGSIAVYMDEVEEGATLPMRGHEGFGIPAAAPGKRKTRGKTPKAKQLGAIHILPRTRGSRKQKIFAAMGLAKKRGGIQHAFLEIKPGRKGIYRLNPGSKRAGIRKVWDLSKRSITKPKNETMSLMVKRVRPLGPGIYREKLIAQLRFHRAFGYGS